MTGALTGSDDSTAASRAPGRRTAGGWLWQALLLVALSLLLSYLLYGLSGGREVADDAPNLIGLARDPFVLWGDYGAAGFSDTWGSFPPLLPLFFGLLVWPWLALFGPFWGIRLGVLSWSIVTLGAFHLTIGRIDGVTAERRRLLMWVFVLLPSLLGAIAFIPQEEIYVALFALALYAAARMGKWRVVYALLLLTMLAGKYFLLVLVFPLAVYSPRPWRNLLLWGGTAAALLGLYIGYHRLYFGLSPILGHMIDPGSSLSVWALFWNLGLRLPPVAVKYLSVVFVVIASFFFARSSRRSGAPLAFAFAGVLYSTLLLLSITVPAYVLWAVPFALICAGMTGDSRYRAWIVLLAVLWGVAEWGANFFRGVKLALETERAAGKTALAMAAERALGAGFPFGLLHVALVALVVVFGIGMVLLIRRSHRFV